jgi:uncharacterized membrane protein HdeD (DUF308 family)
MTLIGRTTPDPATLQRRWKWFLVIGVAMAILGVVALGNLVDATIVTTIVLGFVLLVAGGVQIAGAFTGTATTGWRIFGFILGILYLVVGFDLIADPLRGALTVAWVVGILLVVNGIIRTVVAIAQRGPGWGLGLIVGIIDVLLGLWLLTGLPFTAPAIGLFVGIDLIIGGITWVVLALNVRRAPSGGLPAGAAA